MALRRSWICPLVVTIVLAVTAQSMASIVNIFSEYAPGKPYATWELVSTDWDNSTLSVAWKTSVPADSPFTLFDVKTFVIDVFILNDSLAVEPATYIGGGQWTYRGATATLSGADGFQEPDPNWEYIYTSTRRDNLDYPYVSLGDLAPGEEAIGQVQLSLGILPDYIRGVAPSSDDFATVNSVSTPEPSMLAIWLGLVAIGGLVWRRRRGAA